MNIDSYQTRHVTPGCKCPFIDPKQSDLCAHIDAGRVPLVEITDSENGKIDLELTSADATVPYVAVSHVWTRGLGSFEDSALPTCQLQRLKKMGHQSLSKAHRY